jgi:hypothetical protein
MSGLIFLRRVQNSKSQAFQDLAPLRMFRERQFGTSLVTMAAGRYQSLWQLPEQRVVMWHVEIHSGPQSKRFRLVGMLPQGSRAHTNQLREVPTEVWPQEYWLQAPLFRVWYAQISLPGVLVLGVDAEGAILDGYGYRMVFVKRVLERQEIDLLEGRKMVFYTLHGKTLHPWLSADVARPNGLPSRQSSFGQIVQQEPEPLGEETGAYTRAHTTETRDKPGEAEDAFVRQMNTKTTEELHTGRLKQDQSD